MSLVIEPASKADLPAVMKLYAQPEIDDGKVLSLAKAEAVFARFSAYPDYALYVVRDNEAVVASFTLLVMDNLGHLGAPSAIIEDVVVDPSRHREEIGQFMMLFAAGIARKKGCYKLMLSANLKRDKAHAFYESIGFRRHGYSFVLERDEEGAAP